MLKVLTLFLAAVMALALPAAASAHDRGGRNKQERRVLPRLGSIDDRDRRGASVRRRTRVRSSRFDRRDNFGQRRSELAHDQNAERRALHRHQMSERRLARRGSTDRRALARHQRAERLRLLRQQQRERRSIQR